MHAITVNIKEYLRICICEKVRREGQRGKWEGHTTTINKTEFPVKRCTTGYKQNISLRIIYVTVNQDTRNTNANVSDNTREMHRKEA